jgi:hypothetical protein
MPGAMQRLRYAQATESACAAIGLGYIQWSSQRNTAWTHGLWHPHHSRVRVLTHIKKLDDCFGQFLVRVNCACGASRHVEPEAPGAPGGLVNDAQSPGAAAALLAVRQQSGGCRGGGETRPRGIEKNPHRVGLRAHKRQ